MNSKAKSETKINRALTSSADFATDTGEGEPPTNFSSPAIDTSLEAWCFLDVEKGWCGRISKIMKETLRRGNGNSTYAISSGFCEATTENNEFDEGTNNLINTFVTAEAINVDAATVKSEPSLTKLERELQDYDKRKDA